MYLGHPPFETKTHKETHMRIKTVDLKYPEFLSFEIKDFISKLLVYDKS